MLLYPNRANNKFKLTKVSDELVTDSADFTLTFSNHFFSVVLALNLNILKFRH